MPIETIGKVNDLSSLNNLPAGKKLKFPIADLKNPYAKETVMARGESAVKYDKVSNTIFVFGKGPTYTTIPKIYEKIGGNNSLIEKIGEKEWLLKANLEIGDNVVLVVDGEDTAWLKLKSDRKGFVWLRSLDGGMFIQNAKVTSWDAAAKFPDMNYADGRSFVLARDSGRMDIINSEMSYLGSIGAPKRGGPFGGSYGVSWKVANGTLNSNLLAGSIVNSKLHHNYFGMYSFGATGLVIRDNLFYENVQYGIDPHDDSNGMEISFNVSRNNGNHGIIISRRCVNNLIKGNLSYNNALHGIMLDRQSNRNLVEENTVYGNKADGVALSDSHSNIILGNEIRDNAKSGVRLSASTNYYLSGNEIFSNANGVYLYNGSVRNYIDRNSIKQNQAGVYLKDVKNNFVIDSFEDGWNTADIKLYTGYEKNKIVSGKQ
jgi:parallel beta-helix repeat protein